ncbi:hypothetical protein AMECASPLE_030419 [Ameca splendens]|uniref:Uncharacterized protein n=1 Tax=Ameca splendens TaxID=208324 RepID=A0ABV0ZRF8_9TELE
MGGRWGTPWTGHQSIAGQHRHTRDKQPCTHSFMPMGNIEKPINLIVMFLDRSTRREPTHAQGEHADFKQRVERLGVEPRTFLLQGNSANHCTTVQHQFHNNRLIK